MLGAQRTTVTQVAGVLQRAGAIDYRRGRITVLDRATLERLSCECYSAAARNEHGLAGGVGGRGSRGRRAPDEVCATLDHAA
jgi:hypothetical protein